MLMSKKVQDALDDATKAHEHDKRKYSGAGYVIHPRAVYDILKLVTKDEDVLCAGLLHDVVEDHPDEYSFEDIQKKYGVKVSDILQEVTKDAHKKFHIKSREGLMVKLADMLHNISDCPDSSYVKKKIKFIEDTIVWEYR